ncbi:MAG: hypothetical protein ACYS8Z_02700 [Planctomycetota bacterium]
MSSGRIRNWAGGGSLREGFSVLEVVVVIGIIAVIAGILLPVSARVRKMGKSMECVGNQRQIVTAANLFAQGNDGYYPESVATIGHERDWNWSEPTTVVGISRRSPKVRRSLSAYLRPYIEDAGVMFCPNAPKMHQYAEEAWDSGDDWKDPVVNMGLLIGTYCFYWNYTGYLGPGKVFDGPSQTTLRPGESSVLVSDFFSYDHFRAPQVFGASEKFKGAGVVEETPFSSAYWSVPVKNGDLPEPGLELHAGYSDGHVGSYSAGEGVWMRVIMRRGTGEPYPRGVGPGVFFLPP